MKDNEKADEEIIVGGVFVNVNESEARVEFSGYPRRPKLSRRQRFKHWLFDIIDRNS
jgi:hypothetical protein